MLVEYDPGSPSVTVPRGNDLSRKCFISVLKWLTRLREFAISEEIYSTQILGPVRCPARFILSIRELPRSTMKVTGLVFSRSAPYYDEYFRAEVTTLSIILPELETVSSLRCLVKHAQDLTYGAYDFEQVQPLPFVNRIHPVHPSIEKSAVQVKLSDLDFLKVSFKDFETLSSSVDVENFCEIAAKQSGKKSIESELESRCLARPFILGGRIISVDSPRMTIQSITDHTRAVSMLITERLLVNLGADISAIESLKNTYVRILGVLLYQSGSKQTYYPEILYIEPVDDESELLLDDIVGFVRLRRKIGTDILRTNYGDIDLSLSHSLVHNGGMIEYLQKTQSNDPIVNYFLKEKKCIADLRCNIVNDSQMTVLFPENIFDRTKLRIDGLSKRIFNDRELLNTFFSVLKIREEHGSLPKPPKLMKLVSVPHPEIFREKLRWLIDVGCMERVRRGMIITDTGFSVARLLCQELLKAMNEHVISLPELEERTGLPASLLLGFLLDGEEEAGPLKEVMVNGRRTGLFWTISSSSSAQDLSREATRKYGNLLSQILSSLGSVPHPLAVAKIIEMLSKQGIHMSEFTANILLSELEIQSRVRKDGDTWIYPWEQRICDLLSNNPDDVFTLDEIIRRTSIPPIERGKVSGILEDLSRGGKAVRIATDRWTLPGNEQNKVKELLKAVLPEFILRILNQNRGYMSECVLSGKILYHARQLIPYSRTIPLPELCEQVIEDMLLKGEIIRADGMYRLKDR
jgi:hypothetical protein